MGYERLDRLRVGHDLLLYKITQYILQTKRQTNTWLQILEELTQQDPQVLFYMAEILINYNETKQALNILAQALLEFPQMAPLLI